MYHHTGRPFGLLCVWYAFRVGCPCCLFREGQRRPECVVSQCGNPRFYGFRLRLHGQHSPARPSEGRILRLAGGIARAAAQRPPLGRADNPHRRCRHQRLPLAPRGRDPRTAPRRAPPRHLGTRPHTPPTLSATCRTGHGRGAHPYLRRAQHPVRVSVPRRRATASSPRWPRGASSSSTPRPAATAPSPSYTTWNACRDGQHCCNRPAAFIKNILATAAISLKTTIRMN